MVEEKKKDEEEKPPAPAAKRKLPALVLVAIGAVAGGAGVAIAVPQRTVEVRVEPKPPAFVDVTHPDAIEHEFNPRTQAGKAFGRVAFKFVYTVRDDREKAAFDAIKVNWWLAKSSSLLLLKARTPAELNSESGQRVLEKDLLDALDKDLFPGKGEEKVARITKIVWDKFLMQ